MHAAYQGTQVAQAYDRNRIINLVVILDPKTRNDPDAVANLRDSGEIVFFDIATPGASRSAWRIDRASLAEWEAKRKSNFGK